VIEAKTAELIADAQAELTTCLPSGRLRRHRRAEARLVRSQSERVRRIEAGEQKVSG